MLAPAIPAHTPQLTPAPAHTPQPMLPPAAPAHTPQPTPAFAHTPQPMPPPHLSGCELELQVHRNEQKYFLFNAVHTVFTSLKKKYLTAIQYYYCIAKTETDFLSS